MNFFELLPYGLMYICIGAITTMVYQTTQVDSVACLHSDEWNWVRLKSAIYGAVFPLTAPILVVKFFLYTGKKFIPTVTSLYQESRSAIQWRLQKRQLAKSLASMAPQETFDTCAECCCDNLADPDVGNPFCEDHS